ncbi:unnamed protein product [Darwinula stevensoni]|uniref:O-acyltransferase n=1 Tax=Darwinula stevensoni TaxID=69355 RepID=A0A7R8XAJ8_9CRUS|nr:unnamed protein product [Darwinula stevensoni]CAG0885571.1 unnamed protein product [Darwinula stevensoni]
MQRSRATSDSSVDFLVLQKLRDKTHASRAMLIEQLNKELTEMVDECFTDISSLSSRNGRLESPSSDVLYTNRRFSTSKAGQNVLPSKQFVPRDSLLTELFRINHFQTIFHIFTAILVILFMDNILADLLGERGQVPINLRFDLFFYTFGNFLTSLGIWLSMMCSTFLIYPAFHSWASSDLPRSSKDYFMPGYYGCTINMYLFVSLGSWNIVFLCIFIGYLVAFIYSPVYHLLDNNLPPASSAIVLMEQARLLMKSYAFVRGNIPRVLQHHAANKEEKSVPCPAFHQFLYFLFAPTLVYRDSYPRTKEIQWKFVFSNFVIVLACVCCIYFVCVRYTLPVWGHFGQEPVSIRSIFLSIFAVMIPSTLMALASWFCLLHAWQNAFAEMLRFADRMFYKMPEINCSISASQCYLFLHQDWWNSGSYARYYRTWNIVVHDWLYEYIYKDLYESGWFKNRAIPMMAVFGVSAIVHEYILAVVFRFFFPVLLIMFGFFGGGLMFLPRWEGSRAWNVFLWASFSIGVGTQFSFYSMEWYSRINCPQYYQEWYLDMLVPRCLTCHLDRDWGNNSLFSINKAPVHSEL